MREILDDGELFDLVGQFGSPLNLIHPSSLDANVLELRQVASDADVDFKIFFARKANKCLSLVDRAGQAGIGVDTASENELRQSLERGLRSKALICTAAIKSASLLRRCVQERVVVAVDNRDELELICLIANQLDRSADIAIRLGGFRHDGNKLETRFGFDIERDSNLLGELKSMPIRLRGFHFHLDGYDARQRVDAIDQTLGWWDDSLGRDHRPEFIDMGGGFPMSYLTSGNQWERFWDELEKSLLGQREPITRGNHGLGKIAVEGRVAGQRRTYPYYQSLVRGPWLKTILTASVRNSNVADQLRERGVQLRCEPGRSLLDGCGMTVARVEFCKQSVAGDWLIGLAMNRTQCRTTSDDFLVDPILVRQPDRLSSSAMRGFLMGAYCTESEWITLRRLHFPDGVRRGDLIAFPNTAGYLMHFLESRSHQFPLAKNLICDDGYRLDPIDG